MIVEAVRGVLRVSLQVVVRPGVAHFGSCRFGSYGFCL